MTAGRPGEGAAVREGAEGRRHFSAIGWVFMRQTRFYSMC